MSDSIENEYIITKATEEEIERKRVLRREHIKWTRKKEQEMNDRIMKKVHEIGDSIKIITNKLLKVAINESAWIKEADELKILVEQQKLSLIRSEELIKDMKKQMNAISLQDNLKEIFIENMVNEIINRDKKADDFRKECLSILWNDHISKRSIDELHNKIHEEKLEASRESVSSPTLTDFESQKSWLSKLFKKKEK